MNRPYSKPVIHYFTGNAIYFKTTNMYSSVHEVKTINRIKFKDLSIEKKVTYKINEINQQ